MPVQFSAPLMDAKHFPPSLIKAQPAFTLTGCSLWRYPLPVNNVSTFSRARYALAAAALHLKHSAQQNTVLLPAYHCPALVEPFIYAGYNIVFYPQLADLSTDIATFSHLLTPQVTHVVIVRYFGFSQNADELIQAAFAANKAVIEDNAHSMAHFWQTCATKPPAISASVSSIAKTLGTADGGVLYLPGYKADTQVAAGFTTELKALRSGNRSANRSADADLRYFRAGMQTADCLRASRWLMLRSNYAAISRQRRENYQYLAQQLERSSAGQVLYPMLTEHDVPYVLPFLLHDIHGFTRLRQQQIQVLRWEELATTATGIASNYQQHLVQLPVHQALSKQQLQNIVKALG
ncbi:dTDP-4-amino-4,6-dideoxygalactose transaminase [Rheinheimera pacifica]|uniref:DegT/DnrJ/EryC1/StrS family aminotransferase n=1 Tax=Rheinheimera pacifica TaxID=173990 RepID=UPI002863B265|nr:DegT/DnrJ/EryC1/StrS family aminotransferase [Rheinheimera pacifica]MDR6983603.1 dTDP-4-amino-4,6-dideoxygalactose transaminase [Rheinheimera pacifica]